MSTDRIADKLAELEAHTTLHCLDLVRLEERSNASLKALAAATAELERRVTALERWATHAPPEMPQ